VHDNTVQPWRPPRVETDVGERRPPTAREVQDIFDAAHKAGHEEGVAAGHQAGYATGLSEGRAEMAQAVARLREVLDYFSQPLDELSDSVQEELLQLVISVSQAIIKRKLSVKPADIRRILIEALSCLPAANRSGEIYLHPGEAKRVLRGDHPAPGFTICEDTAMAPGGCRIVAGDSNIDASLHHRIYELTGTVFGRDDDGHVEGQEPPA